MHLYRLSENQQKDLNIILDKFVIGECKMDSVREAMLYASTIDNLKKALSKDCSDQFVLKEEFQSEDVQIEKESKKIKAVK